MSLKRLMEIRRRKQELKSSFENLKEKELDDAIKEVDALDAEEKELRTKLDAAEEVEKKGLSLIMPGQQPEQKTFGLDSDEYRSAYLKDLKGDTLDEVEKRALTTNTNSVGKAIPTQTMNRIVEKLRQESVALSLVTILHIPSNVSMPVEGTTNDAEVKAEGVAATDKADTINSINLTAYKLIKTISITAEVKAMTIDAFEDFIINLLVKKIKALCDYLIINGSGSGQPTGIITAIGANAKETASSSGYTYTDFMTLLGALPSGYAKNAKLMANRKFIYETIAALQDSQNRPIFKLETDGRFEGKLLGYPVVSNDDVPDNKIIFGDFEYYFFNFVEEPTVKADESVGFRSGDVCYRVMCLADGNVGLGEAFVVMGKKA